MPKKCLPLNLKIFKITHFGAISPQINLYFADTTRHFAYFRPKDLPKVYASRAKLNFTLLNIEFLKDFHLLLSSWQLKGSIREK